MAKRRNKIPTVVLGTLGADAHMVGIWILNRALMEAGLKVVFLGAVVPQQEFIDAAIETNADAILVSSLYGMGVLDCEGMRDACTEAGLIDILLYVGGLLIATEENWENTKQRFLNMGFNRVYPPQTLPRTAIEDLKRDLSIVD